MMPFNFIYMKFELTVMTVWQSYVTDYTKITTQIEIESTFANKYLQINSLKEMVTQCEVSKQGMKISYSAWQKTLHKSLRISTLLNSRICNMYKMSSMTSNDINRLKFYKNYLLLLWLHSLF